MSPLAKTLGVKTAFNSLDYEVPRMEKNKQTNDDKIVEATKENV